MLQITHNVRDNLLLVNLVGSLNGQSREMLAGILDEWLATGGKYTLIDFSGVTYISSEGLKVLLHHASELHKANGRVVLASVHDSIFQVFEVGGFTRFFEFADTIDDGLSLLTATESSESEGR